MTPSYQVKAFFHDLTSTFTYVIWYFETNDAVVIDAALDYDDQTSQITFASVEKVIQFIKTEKLKLHHILETHAHADHLSAAQILKREFPDAQIGIGAGIADVQHTFQTELKMPAHFRTDGSQFEYLFSDKETFMGGSLAGQVITTPGHTPACVSYLIGDSLFTGDCLFMPDIGTGRCDFPGGSAVLLYQSVHEKLFKLSDNTKVYVGHDYPPHGRELQFRTTIGEQKARNIHLSESTSLSDYVQFRDTRDRALKPPKLLTPSLTLNLNAGILPEPNTQGEYFLKLN